MKLRFAVAAIVGALASVVAPAPAGAHAFLVRSEPADAASLSVAPRELRLVFSERLRPEFTRLEIRDLRGETVAFERLRVSGHEILASLPRLPRGTYSLDWNVLSVEDSHLSKGAIAFGVGAHPTARSDRDGPTPPPEDAALRWLLLTSMAVAVGGLAVAQLVLSRVAATRARARALGLSARAAVAGLIAGIAILAWQAELLDRTTGDGWWSAVGRLLGSRFGATWAAREGLLALLLALVLVARSRRDRGRAAAGALGVACGLAVAQALSGHANVAEGARPAVVAADAAHLLAAAVWVGGLIALGLALRGEKTAVARACWRRFGAFAGAAVALIAVTGLYLAARNVASADSVLSSLYGRVLLGKVLLLGAAGALGLASAAALRARRKPARVTRLTRAEATVGAAILAAAGVLSAAAPARGPQWVASPPVPDSSAAAAAADLVVRLGVHPNRPGDNVYDVFVTSTRRPPPAPVDRVSLRFVAPDGRVAASQPLQTLGAGRYRLGGSQLVRDGSWRLAVVVSRRTLPLETVPFAWTVASATPPRPVLVSDRPIGGMLELAALAIALAAFAVGVSVALRRFVPPRLPALVRPQRMS